MLQVTVSPSPVSRKIFLMCVSKRARQLGVSAVVGQHEDHRRTPPIIAARSRVTRHCPFAPMRPRLQPEDLRHDVATLGGGEQRAGNYGIGLGDSAVEVITTTLAQRLWRAADDLGDVVLTDANPSQMAHLFAYRLIENKRFSSHRRSLIDLCPGCGRVRQTIDPRLDGSRCAR